jgi:hypothetical protein
MANEVANRASAGALAAAQALKANLTKVAATLPAGQKGFLKFGKDGAWVFGQDNTELAKGTEVAINPLSIQSGYSSWTDFPKEAKKKNELVGEFLVPLGAPLPPKHTMKDTGWEWRDLRVIEMKVLTGPHKDKELSFSTTSDGGLRAIKAILDQVIVQLDEDPEYIVPVVKLDSSWYMHKQWGKTFTPVMDIVDFMSMDGPEEAAEGDEAPVEEPPKERAPERGDSAPAGRGTRQTEMAEPEPEPEPEPAQETEAPARRRRR